MWRSHSELEPSVLEISLAFAGLVQTSNICRKFGFDAAKSPWYVIQANHAAVVSECSFGARD
jgi:hypothetical protein